MLHFVCVLASLFYLLAAKDHRHGTVSLTHDPVGSIRSSPRGPTNKAFLDNLERWRKDLIDGVDRRYKYIRQESGEEPFRMTRPHKVVWNQPLCTTVFPKGTKPVENIFRHENKPDKRNKVYLVEGRMNGTGDPQKFVLKTFAKHGEFMAEMKALSVLDHPNIVKPICWVPISENSDRLGIIMEYVEGVESGKWARHVKRQSSIRKMVAQLFSVVTYIHYMGFLHSDLKPSNLIVTPDERLVVIDWGFAEYIWESKPHRGTLAYYPPEKGGTVVINQKGDLVTDQSAGSWAAALNEGSDWWTVGLITITWYGDWMLESTNSSDRYHPIKRRREDGVYEFQPVINSIPSAVRSFCHLLLQANPKDRQINTPRLLMYMQTQKLFEGLKWETYHGKLYPSISAAAAAGSATVSEITSDDVEGEGDDVGSGHGLKVNI